MKKGFLKASILILLVIILVIFVGYRINMGKKELYEEVTAKVKDISTYYTFKGNIEVKNKQEVISNTNSQIYSIKVKEGEKVEEGDTLYTLVNGKKIKANIAGEVTKIYVNEDDAIIVGNPIMDIVNYDDLKITIKLDEYDIKAIEVGKEVFIHINALEKDINGTIGSISKEATETNGVSYFTSEVDVKQDGTLRVGMSTEIKTLNKSVTNAVTIPMEVVQFDKENNPFVYFKDSEGNVKRKDIKVGINDGNTVEIIEGISENETVLYPAKISLMDVSFKDLKKE